MGRGGNDTTNNRWRRAWRGFGACVLATGLAATAFAADTSPLHPPAPRSTPPPAAPAEIGHLDIAPTAPGRLPWVVFDERSGLPQHTIVDLLQDQRGFVWAATQDGPARYNGHAWESVPLPTHMRSSYARVMRIAADGGLWIGSFDGGLAHYRDGAWQTWSTRDGLPSNRIRGMLPTRDAHGPLLWIATDRGIARWQDGRITAYGTESGLPNLDTEALLEVADDDGVRRLYVGTTQGLARRVGDRFEPVPVPKELLGHRIDDAVESPGLHGGQALWIASYGAGMAVRENGRWTQLDTRSGLPSNVEVFARSRADDGSPALWIGTEGGLLRFEHGRFTLFDERSGLPIRILWKVLETTTPDGNRTLWLGTWGGGVVRLSPNGWKAFDASTGMPSGSVTSMLLSREADGREVVWAGTSDGELARLAGDRFESVPLPEVLRHGILFSLLQTVAADGSPVLWVASFGNGVGRLEHGRWTLFDTKQLPNQRVYQIVRTQADDGSEVLWFATDGGIGRLQAGRWTRYGLADGLPSDVVTQLLEITDRDGRRTMWTGTSKGIARLEGERWIAVDDAHALAGKNVLSLQVTTDPDGTRWLWAGTFSRGAARLRLDDADGAWEIFSTHSRPALPSDTVLSVAEDRAGRVYLCTTRGVARLTPRAPTDASDAHFRAELFNIDDGLPSGDCQQAARLVDAHGRVWMGTARGLAMFDPRTERPDRSPKPLRIDRAQLSDGSLTLRGGEALAYDQHNLTFHAALLAYGGESRVRYRYQLVGFDPQPSDWLVANSKEYTNLGAGSYRLLVWGRDARGNVSGPQALAFSVKPAPWLTPWAYAAYVAAVLLAAWGAMQWRVRALAARTRLLETEVAARTRDLVAARDELARLATEDALTGIANRRKFDTVVAQEWKRAQRDGHLLSLALLDVDFFKKYNDRYGHAEGDACLRAVAQAVAAQCTRSMDLVARYGGEEFVLVLPDIDAEGVRRLLRSVLRAVDALQLAHADSSVAPHVTVSLGAVTLRPGPHDELHTAIEHADALLYRAKESGRHRAVHGEGAAEVEVLVTDAEPRSAVA
jgi:diguanylate cyclase (GGDEF)-like protein